MARQFILACAIGALLLIGVGCTAMTPQIQQDNARIAADNAQIASLNTQFADLKTKIAAASTQPAATQPTIFVQLPGATTQPADATPLLTQLLAQQQKVNADLIAAQRARDADQAKKDADTVAAQQQQVQQGSAVAQAAVGAIPGPWTPFAQQIIQLAGMGLIAWLGKRAIGSALDNHAATMQVASDNHAATVQQALVGLAQSVPVDSLPQPIQGVARATVAAVGAVIDPASKPT